MAKHSVKVIKAVYERSPEYITAYKKEAFRTSGDAFNWFRNMRDETKEVFAALHLDTKNQIICADIVSVGSLSASIVHPREVFKTALLSSASAIIFVHNHPSGDPTPSREDIDITKRLKECGDLLGIRVLDHIVVGDGRYVSFADRGMM